MATDVYKANFAGTNRRMARGERDARERENTWNSRLVEALHKRGFPSARFEPIYEVVLHGRKTTRKPDLDFKDGGTHFISGKFGQSKELEAYRSASEYQNDLRAIVPDMAEVFAVVYPATRAEKFRLHVLPSAGRAGEVPFSATSLDDLADRIVAVVKGRLHELTREPLLEEAPRLLLNGARQLAAAMVEVPDEDLEAIFGGHDFFVSVLQHRLKDAKKRRDALRMGGAYLFTNQLLFYLLLSRAAVTAGIPAKYPAMARDDFDSPTKIRDRYFEKVRDINYEPIYGFDVAQYLIGEGAQEACHNLVVALHGLVPNLDYSDLVGQVFQTLIPYEIRKPLGANFTNPKAAKLLAALAIENGNVKVLDPACGSGTLLVASYQRKLQLSKGTDASQLHERFVEKDITGMDAMAFSAHLAVVNLASQQPLVNTEHVRIATTDSTIRKPGEFIEPSQEALPHEFLQARLTEEWVSTPRRAVKRGVVQASKRKKRALELEAVDLVIMNPPFTSWDNMGKIYRDNMKLRFANESRAYKEVLFWKISQQAFFFLLADRFLKPTGTVAAVTPFTTFTGRAFHKFTEWFIKNYTVDHLIVGLERCSFSEDTSLTECLIVARKQPPPAGHSFTLVGTHKDPADWTADDLHKMLGVLSGKRGSEAFGLVTTEQVAQTDLHHAARTLTDLFLGLLPKYRQARVALEKVLTWKRAEPVSTFAKAYKVRGFDLTRWVLGSEHLPHYGSEALIACRSEERAVRQKDRLVVHDWDATKALLKDRNAPGTPLYSVPAGDIVPALRRFSYLPTLDSSEETDLCIARRSEALEKIMAAVYGDQAKTYLSRIKETGKWKGERWTSRVGAGSSNVLIARRIDFSSPGTTLLSVWTKKPTFLAADGYLLRGLKEEREGKFVVLWLNSSLAIHRMLGNITITRGTWAKIEEFMLEKLAVPAWWHFSDETWERVDELWKTVANTPFPSLMTQLAGQHEGRMQIDQTMLEILGVPEKESSKIATEIRQGVLEALVALKRTMGDAPAGQEPDEPETTEP